ncbi:MAG TPA: hypothetical protein VKQ72_16130 [Aggregatilineales bacterium]|nr:hypothetical protein [Aggregatilineales bacterium]
MTSSIIGNVCTPEHIPATQILLAAEAAAAFEELTLTNRDDLLARQNQDAWPTTFRRSRLIPAVEYIQAQRVRSLLIRAMGKIMAELDVYLAPTFQGDNLLLTNMTGHPAAVIPNGTMQNGKSASVTFTGRLYDESTVLAVARRFQDATDYHRQIPPLPGN